MSKNKFLLRALVLMMVITLILTGCTMDTSSSKPTDPTGSTGSTGSNPAPATLSAAPRAVPIAASTSTKPEVLDSYTDGIKNYYLIDVGYVKNTFVSTVVQASYNGMTPMSVSKITINASTITEVLTDTITESITISDTQKGKVGVEGAWKNKFPGIGEFSAKLKLEWTGSWTKSKTSSKSTETSVAKTESYAEKYTTSFTVGEHGEPAGNYRVAVYAICDVYFVISTSLDNQTLLGWDTVVCARESSYSIHSDYSTDIFFDNSPEGNEITFPEDFYKGLKKPDKTEPSDSNPTTITTDFETIRTDTKKITDSGRFHQHMDVVDFNVFDINLNAKKQEGYKTISFYIQLDVREIDDGYQWLFLFNSPNKSYDYRLAKLVFEHSDDKKDTDWWVHYETELKFENISLDKFMNNEFVIRYGADGLHADDWENKELKIQLVIKP